MVMNMKIHNIAEIIFILLISFLPSETSCDDNFNPLQSTIATGDQNYAAHTHEASSFGKNVFSAPIAAGYFLIRFFQIVISPQDGPSCRFHPTCSTYGKQAVIKHGIVAGSFLAGERLIRCNPYNRGGDDPVPEKIFE